MTINHKIDYKSYCKYSLLYEAVMRRTEDLHEVTKSLKSLILSLHATGKQQKDVRHVSCSKPLSLVSSMSSMLLLWKVRKYVGNRRRPPHKVTDSFAGLPRPTGSREPPNSPKVELCFEVRSLYCNHLSLSLGDGLLLPQTCNKIPA